MKSNLLILSFLLVLVLNSYSQNNQNDELNGLGVGFQLNEYQKDFGLGVNITSPYFAKKTMAVRLRGNFMYHEHLKNEKIDWTAYNNLTLGIVSGKTKITESIALYGEGGIVAIFPSSDFSSNEMEFGGYGLFGFEFYFVPEFSYFFEAGGIGTGAVANELHSDPIYSNGFLISVGCRAQF